MSPDSPLSTSPDATLQSDLEQARKRFLARVKDIRPRLHRFCARMTGSALDGEDLVQETLAQAFYNLGSLKDESRLEPWLFRIAHNKCVDFLRRERRQREETVAYIEEDVPGDVAGEPGLDEEPVSEALAALVAELPPMERASVLLKDVLDYRLAEIAEVLDSTVGAVKAALHRGRTRLRALHQVPRGADLDPEQRALVDSYIEYFNRRDWDGLRRLIQADARIEIVGFPDTTPETYFGNYSAMPWQWRMSLARVDGEPLIVHWRRIEDRWVPHTAVRLWWREGKVVRIRDYVHMEYLLRYSRTEAPELA